MMWNARWLWIKWRGNLLHLVLIWGTPIYSAFLRWHQCSSLVVTVFLGILFSSIREIEVPYIFDWEHGTPQQAMPGNRASSWGEGEVSWLFSRDGLLCSWLNAGSYFISQDEGMTESPVETLEKAIVNHLFWTESLAYFYTSIGALSSLLQYVTMPDSSWKLIGIPI